MIIIVIIITIMKETLLPQIVHQSQTRDNFVEKDKHMTVKMDT